MFISRRRGENKSDKTPYRFFKNTVHPYVYLCVCFSMRKIFFCYWKIVLIEFVKGKLISSPKVLQYGVDLGTRH